jgi:hypothetical protein
VVPVLAGVEDGGQGLEGVVGDDGGHGGLPAGPVPHDADVEYVEQAGFEVGGEGVDVAGVGDLVEDGGVGGLGLVAGEGG